MLLFKKDRLERDEKMYKKSIFVLLLLFCIPSISMASSEFKWEYVLTRNNTSYSVEMNSVHLIPIGMNFLLASEDSDKLSLLSTTIDVGKMEFRFE